MMGQLTPGGVADDTSRDGAEGVPSRASVESFWSKGRLLPPVLGPRHKGIRTRSYYGGGETVQIQFGEFGHHTEVWTTLEGVEALIGDLQAAVVRARIALEAAEAANYRALADRFRSGDQLNASELDVLHRQAVAHDNYLLAERTA